MLSLVVFSLFFYQVYAKGSNYADLDLASIREEFDRKLAATYYDILILKSHVVTNARFVEDAIGQEVDRLLVNELTCHKQLEVEDTGCHMETIFENLYQTRDKFAQLQEVACSTLELCHDLNPLASQGSGLEKCSLSKIGDLRRQSRLVTEEFESLKRKLFEDHDYCVRDLMSVAFTKIGTIMYNCKVK